MPKLITENYEITELDNGIRIVSEYIPYFRSISLGIWVASGSRNEAKQLAGISHLIAVSYTHLDVYKRQKESSAVELLTPAD